MSDVWSIDDFMAQSTVPTTMEDLEKVNRDAGFKEK
jgi:hypothetical protein